MTQKLDLTPDEWVEVRSEAEILSTLDDDGTLDGLPFMPELLAHCGRRYQVFKRADKTCDTIAWTGLRRLERTVHLKMLRCDGSAHGGCQAACLIFWKEAWLRRSPGDRAETGGPDNASSTANSRPGAARDRAWLEATTQRMPASGGETLYRCQATEMNNASCPLPWWEPGQYVRDVRMNNVPLTSALYGIAVAIYSKVLQKLTGRCYPDVAGSLKRTPTEDLGLKIGEWVIVKSKEEILATLDSQSRNRGMKFDAEMLVYCGKRVRVLRRVERLIEEPTGKMLELPGVALILENVICVSRYKRSCPRAIYPYWREIWLRRAGDAETSGDAEGGSAQASHEQLASQ